MNPRRRRRLRRRHRLCAWVESWAQQLSATYPLRWAEAWREYARTGDSFLLSFDDAQRSPGWRTWGIQAGLRAYRQGARP